MSEEKEVASETNGKGDKEEETEDSKSTVEETNAEETEDKENNEEGFDLDSEIIRQVEYYFGDVNLSRDRYLQHQVNLDDGWVPLDILMKFNRLSKLSSDIDVIENALKKSTSGLLEIADKKIRRNPEQPVPEMNEDRRKEIASRTIYAKGFSKEASLDEILKFFKDHGDVENVIMRRYLDTRAKTRPFKGSVFATFKTKAEADKFVAAKNSMKYKDTNLLVMWPEEYDKLKQEEKQDRYKKREKKMKHVTKTPALTLPTGTVLHFEDGSEKMTREEIKSAVFQIDKKCDVAFVDYKIGLTNGWIRFAQLNAAVEFYKLLDDGKLSIGGKDVTVKLLEGDEEKQYLDKTVEEMTKRRKGSKSFKHKGKNNYKGKQMKRRRDDVGEDGPPAKVQCDS